MNISSIKKQIVPVFLPCYRHRGLIDMMSNVMLSSFSLKSIMHTCMATLNMLYYKFMEGKCFIKGECILEKERGFL